MQNEMIQLTIANTLDQTAKQRVEVQGNQTLKQVVQQRNLAPNGSFDVYDQVGKVITNQAAANHRDATVYVGVAKVAGGGIPLHDIDRLKIEYPSLKTVNQWTDRQEVKMVIVQFPSGNKTKSGFWQVAVYCPQASDGSMSAYVLNDYEIVKRPRVSVLSSTTIPGSNRRGSSVCIGSYLSITRNSFSSAVERVGAFINHIQNLLNE